MNEKDLGTFDCGRQRNTHTWNGWNTSQWCNMWRTTSLYRYSVCIVVKYSRIRKHTYINKTRRTSVTWSAWRCGCNGKIISFPVNFYDWIFIFQNEFRKRSLWKKCVENESSGSISSLKQNSEILHLHVRERFVYRLNI